MIIRTLAVTFEHYLWYPLLVGQKRRHMVGWAGVQLIGGDRDFINTNSTSYMHAAASAKT